jgi:hypothetical protein
MVGDFERVPLTPVIPGRGRIGDAPPDRRAHARAERGREPGMTFVETR